MVTESPKKSFKSFLKSVYCDIDESDFEEFAQFLADGYGIYEEDYKKLRYLTEWQNYVEVFKEYKADSLESELEESVEDSSDGKDFWKNFSAKVDKYLPESGEGDTKLSQTRLQSVGLQLML